MTLAQPVWLLTLPVLLAVVVATERRLEGHRRRRWARGGARFLLLGLLVLALAGPERAGSRPFDLRIVVAVDRSAALGGEVARREALAEVERAAEAAAEAGAELTLLGFAESAAPPYPGPGIQEAWPGAPEAPWPDAPPTEGATPVPEPPGAGRTGQGRAAVGLAAAALAFGPDEAGGVLLITSGHGPTLDGLSEAAASLPADRVRLRAVALPREAPPVPAAPRVVALDLPDRPRGPFDVAARLESAGPLTVRLLVDGTEERRQEVEGDGTRRDAAVRFADVALSPGAHEISLVVGPADGAARPALVRRIVDVDAPPRVLVAVEDPSRSPTRRAATAQGFRLANVRPEEVGMALGADAAPPDAVLLDPVAAARIPLPVREALAAQVAEGLGLFVEAGTGEEEWAALGEGPLGRVLPLRPVAPPPAPPPVEPPPPPAATEPPVEPPEPDGTPGLRAERRPEEALPISLVLVLDRSGSMVGRKLAMAIEAARRAAGALSEFDRVGVVTFADESTLDVPPTSVRRLGDLVLRLATLQAHGNTDIYGALARAARVLAREDAPIRHVILLTDGRQNAAEALFGPLVRRMGREEITLTAVGLGMRHDEVLLKKLVQFAPRGRYMPADTEAELPTILTRDTQRVAEARAREAHAMARIPDPERPAPEAPPERPPEPTPPAPGPPEPATPPSPEVPEAPALARLHLLRPHEATRGVDERTLPAVGAPRPAEALPLGALLLVRGTTGEPVLAARRVGLGRVLAFALPPDADGLAGWPDLGRILVQGLRSVRAPEGAFPRDTTPRVLHTPGGARLRVDAPEGEAEPVRAWWAGPGGDRDLGTVLPGHEIPLPPAPPGALASVRLVPLAGGAGGPPLTYVSRGGNDEPQPRAGDRAALARALGAWTVSPDAPLLPVPVPRHPAPRPMWPIVLALAVALVPLDAALHRRAEARA